MIFMIWGGANIINTLRARASNNESAPIPRMREFVSSEELFPEDTGTHTITPDASRQTGQGDNSVIQFEPEPEPDDDDDDE